MANLDVKFDFENNKVEINRAIEGAIGKFLLEASAEVVSQVADNTTVASGQLKGSWGAVVKEEQGEAIIGSPLENAIWEEFGTGEYALEGKRSSGYWVYVKGESGKKDTKSTKRYTLEQAKRIVAIMRKKGLEAYYTKGKRPKRALFNAFQTCKPAIIRRAQKVFKARFKE